MPDYYEILGIPEQASAADIKFAFKRLAVKYHPDKNPGNFDAEEKFKSINTAYQVLSNPDKKARYDLILQYSRNVILPEQREPARYEPMEVKREASSRYRRRNYRDYDIYDRFDRKHNRIGNIWALSFLLSIIMITLVSTIWNNYRQDKYRQQVFASNQEYLQEAKRQFRNSNFQAVFLNLDKVNPEFGQASEVLQLRDQVAEEVVKHAEVKFRNADFQESKASLEMLQKHYNRVSFNALEILARSYLELGNHQQAISVFNYLNGFGYNVLTNHLDLGKIYSDKLNDQNMALHHFLKAMKEIEKFYQNTYGDAYPVLVNPSKMPEEHYIASYHLAMTYYRRGEYQKASENANWATLLRPNQPESYYLKGNCFEKLGQAEQACMEWAKASLRGSEEAGSKIKNICNNLLFR
jgi:curved DNA-binding protein CbpA